LTRKKAAALKTTANGHVNVAAIAGYIRVSTAHQGRSGFSREAQRAAIVAEAFNLIDVSCNVSTGSRAPAANRVRGPGVSPCRTKEW
jgi:hypothetical protein